MELLTDITNGVSLIALFGVIVLSVLVKKEGTDERARFMGFKLFSFLFTFQLAGLSLIILVTGWNDIGYTWLRICITSLFSLTILVGLGYWIYLGKKV
ncbi:hypothetical protein [Cohnella sp. 56]|uniref:hypothetical protein n=1 Tax=Cohnella sp. 56 TaxID=3113722 RepID=UPI0030E9DD10